MTFTKAKDLVHPKWYPNSKVYCDGQLVLTVGSTKPRLDIDVWSGNHPFYTGSQELLDVEGRVARFLAKYGLEENSWSLDFARRGQLYEKKNLLRFPKEQRFLNGYRFALKS